eukprot:1306621-Pyramimonas_sp.AAC.1
MEEEKLNISERVWRGKRNLKRTASESCESRPERTQRRSNLGFPMILSNVVHFLTFSRFQPSKIEGLEGAKRMMSMICFFSQRAAPIRGSCTSPA